MKQADNVEAVAAQFHSIYIVHSATEAARQFTLANTGILSRLPQLRKQEVMLSSLVKLRQT